MTLRTPTVEDAGAIADLCNALTRDLYGEADANEQTVTEWFGLPDLGMFLVERDGRVAGYLDVRCDDEGRRFPVDLRIHPDARGSGVADELLEAAEEWERERAEPGGLSRGFVAERDGEARGAYERRGYGLIRHSFFMEIDLPEQPEPPEWPSGIAVRTFDRERDEQAVFECNQESFADHWDFSPIPIERWRTFAFGDRHDPSLWWLAEDGGEVAAA